MHEPASLAAFQGMQAQAARLAAACARAGRLPDSSPPEGAPAQGAAPEIRTAENFSARARSFPLRNARYVPRRQFQDELLARFGGDLSAAAVNALKEERPAYSAHRLLTAGQKIALAAGALVAAGAFAFFPLATLIAFNAALTVYFLAAIAFRLLLVGVALDRNTAPRAAPPLADEDLPVITILLPAYDEAACLANLSAAIARLDYPAGKLDIKLILETEDLATRAEAARLGLDRLYEIVILPPSQPRTKPKACNYALYLARGALTVVYDAEDEPEPDQLRKAAAAFADDDAALACAQARLNYYNADENWLTRLFTLEYSLWFDSMLPALERLKVPIPLGGTSNFFRTHLLIEMGGWDPYNVTEDADLGLRLARLGYRTRMLDSTTFEEASARVDGWVRQRSRWMKGHMQTWLVHMRDPRGLRAFVGRRGVFAAHLFLVGNIVSALVNPLLWGLFAVWILTQTAAIGVLFPGPLLAMNLVALIVGNGLFFYLAAVGPLKRGRSDLSPAAVLTPVYWALATLAAYKALWQLFTRPTYWEKTAHMTSRAGRARARARRS